MPLISGLVERRDTVEGCEFPTLNFPRKERENCAGPGTSANDLKQEWVGRRVAVGEGERQAIKGLYRDTAFIRNCVNCLSSGAEFPKS
jgi:hypothetical protein